MFEKELDEELRRWTLPDIDTPTEHVPKETVGDFGLTPENRFAEAEETQQKDDGNDKLDRIQQDVRQLYSFCESGCQGKIIGDGDSR